MTSVKTQGGFTIVEVVLFLALSGLVFIIGFAGIGGRNRQVQFNDSMRSLHSSLQADLNEVFNGVKDGVVDDPAVNETLLGKYIAFCSVTNAHPRCLDSNGSRVLVYDVKGDLLDDSVIANVVAGTGDCGISSVSTDIDFRLIDCSSPRVDGDPEVFDIDWGTIFIGANRDNYALTTPGYGFLRSPNSSRVITFSHAETAGGPSDSDVPSTPETQFLYFLETGNEMFNTAKRQIHIGEGPVLCFLGVNDQYATINVGVGNQNNALDISFDPEFNPSNPKPSQHPLTCGDN